MAVRTDSSETERASSKDIERLYELLRDMRDDIRDIKERIERIDKPINSGKDD